MFYQIEGGGIMPVSMKTLLEQYTKILQKIYGKHLKSVILYGSYARGDYREDSDIDIMILLDLSYLKLDCKKGCSTRGTALSIFKLFC